MFSFETLSADIPAGLPGLENLGKMSYFGTCPNLIHKREGRRKDRQVVAALEDMDILSHGYAPVE